MLTLRFVFLIHLAGIDGLLRSIMLRERTVSEREKPETSL